MTLSSNTTGLEQKPCLLENRPGRTCQSGLPSKSCAEMTTVPFGTSPLPMTRPLLATRVASVSVLSRKVVKMLCPSVAGVLEAWLLRRWMLSMGALTTFDCQSVLPVARSRQSNTRCSVSATAETMKMRSCHTMGDAWPLPGSSAFHVTLPSAEIGKPLSAKCHRAEDRATAASFQREAESRGREAGRKNAESCARMNARKQHEFAARLEFSNCEHRFKESPPVDTSQHQGIPWQWPRRDRRRHRPAAGHHRRWPCRLRRCAACRSR
jgi:hypothetical protein